MQIGRRLYYELATGNVVLNTGERSGSVVATTVEQDFATYTALVARVPETIGVLTFEYGEFAADFTACNGYHVNLTTGAVEFSYPDPDDPTDPPVYEPPLSEKVAQLETEKAALQSQLEQLNGDFAGFLDFYFAQNPTQA